jgi:hypothetical protein
MELIRKKFLPLFDWGTLAPKEIRQIIEAWAALRIVGKANAEIWRIDRILSS